ncbi:sterile alpha motif domain-containing protein 9-like [Branchiostoma floridae x Branchiostoma japonicum]
MASGLDPDCFALRVWRGTNMAVDRDHLVFRNGARCDVTSYTVWPTKYFGQLTPRALLRNIDIQKVIAEASLDKRLSSCHQRTRKKNKPKKRTCFVLQNTRLEPDPLDSHVKKKKKKHKVSCKDPYHIKDMDQIDSLVAEFTAEEKEKGDTPDVPCDGVSQQVSQSHGETPQEDPDVVSSNEPRSCKSENQSEEEQKNSDHRSPGLFMVYVRQLNNEVVGVTLQPSDTLAELRTAIKCPAAKVKFYHCGKQLREKLPLNAQDVAEGSNIDLHVGLLGGADRDPDAEKHKLSENMEKWSEDDVEDWLRRHVKLKDGYIKKIKEEEVNGINVKNTFTLQYLMSTIQMKTGPALKLIGKRDAFVNKKVQQEDKITSMSVEDVCRWLKYNESIKLKEQYVSKFRDEEFDGWNLKYSLNEEYLKKTIGMKSGPMTRLLAEAKNLKPVPETDTSCEPVVWPKETQDTASSKPQTKQQQPPTNRLKCAPRPFGQYKDHTYSYHCGRIMDIIETGVTDLMNPAREFKFSRKQGDELVEFFLSETLHFSCACLNVRTNGTIHFGITDPQIKSTKYQGTEVVGLSLNQTEMANIEEKLTACMIGDKCFQKEDQRQAAQKCISLTFVKVSGIEESRFVIEVDVTPYADVCKGIAFCVCLPRGGKKQSYDDAKYFQRVGSSSCVVKPRELGSLLKQVLKDDNLREKKEKEEISAKSESLHLAETLKSLFCHDSPQKMSSFYHILVANKPPAELIENGYLDFITCIDWVAVFDFDPDSYTTGLAKLYEKKGMSEYFSEQFSSDYHSLENLKDLCDKIKFRTLPLWLSCNGRKDMEHIGRINQETCTGEELAFEVRSFENSEWYRNRRKGVKDAISFLSKEDIIPDQSKVVITFLLFSEDYEIVVDTFRNFDDDFKIHRLLYIAENDAILHGWNTELEKVYSRDEHKKRGIVGMPWYQVNESIKRYTGAVEEGEGMLPSSTGFDVVLKERDRKLWNYLDVVCKNECENSEKLKDEAELERHRKEKEEEFWKGKKVDWWNFWLTENYQAVNGQVLRRDNHDTLKDIIVDNLKGDVEGEQRSVNIVQLFHHPGAGGSTMARHILWELRKKYRCAVVKSPTVKSCEQILNLYLHGETSGGNPVLILIDDPDFGEAELREFKSKIQSEIRKRLVEVGKSMPVCVLLHCVPSTSAQDLKQQNPTASIVLEQYLSPRERNWCNQQLEHSLNNCPERDPHQFLSFMIFKEDSNSRSTYIEQTVRGILRDIDIAQSAKLVLKYVSLLNKFVKGSGIPVARCKPLFGIDPRNPRAERIEDLLSPSAQLLLVEITKEEEIGTVPCFCTAHPLLAEQILNQLLEKDGQTFGELTLDFLKSNIFMEYRFAREYMVKVTRQMLKEREFKKDRIKKTDFSPLILHICDQEDNVEKAVEIMKYAYELFEDGLLAQQAARLLYIKAKDFDEARKYAFKGAADKRSSYTLDTIGQVEKEYFHHRYQSYIDEKSELSPEDAKEAIKLAFKAMECFQYAQEANKDKGDRNLAGFVGEVDVCFQLLRLLQCIPLFKGDQGLRLLREYLMSDNLPPRCNLVKDCWDEFHSHFSNLGGRIDKTLKYVVNMETYYKHDFLSASKVPLGFLETSYRDYTKYFCESPEAPIENVRNIAVQCALRRSQVAALRGNNFYNIFQLVARKEVDTLKRIRDMLRANVDVTQHRKPSDIQNYILVNLALVSAEPSAEVTSESLNSLCDLSEKLVEICDGEEAYPYFFLYMFMWPVKNMNVRYSHNRFKDALKKLIELDKKYRYRRSSREGNKPYDRIQATEYQPRAATLFFLGKVSGTLKQFVHFGQLPHYIEPGMPILRGLQGSIKRDQFWKNPAIPETLYRLKGTEYDGTIYLENIRYIESNPEEKNIKIRPAVPSRSGSSKRTVSFYLGFSFEGPVAYDVQTILEDEGATGHSCVSMPSVEKEEVMCDETEFDWENASKAEVLSKTEDLLQQFKRHHTE